MNVVVRDGSKLRGYNSDLDGIRAGLVAILPRVQGKWPRSAIVLGAGGGENRVITIAGNGPVAVVAADLNADSSPDVAVANFYSASVSVLLNDGDWVGSSFGPVKVSGGTFAADLESDGALAKLTVVGNNVLIENVAGKTIRQPYLDLSAPPGAPGASLKSGDHIPLARTSVAVEYKRLFDGASPVARSKSSGPDAPSKSNEPGVTSAWKPASCCMAGSSTPTAGAPTTHTPSTHPVDPRVRDISAGVRKIPTPSTSAMIIARAAQTPNRRSRALLIEESRLGGVRLRGGTFDAR